MVAVARILVGVTGGIAAYKACELVRLLVRAGHDVTPITTRAAERFVAADTFWALARKTEPADPYPHLVDADLLVVAPLTANTMARLAHGLADDLLTETALAHRGPLVLAPAMNTTMWEHPATQANIAVLVERGAVVVERALVQTPKERNGSLAGRRVLVTAGGTREPLDSVRFLGNRSSGRMGVALAAEARRRGAEVILLAANLAVDPPPGVETIPAPTAEAMLDAALALPDVDIVLMAAAVADYRPIEAIGAKRAKGEQPWAVELAPTADIARTLGERKRPGQILVLFGAEHGEEGLARKRSMLETKNADLVVFND